MAYKKVNLYIIYIKAIYLFRKTPTLHTLVKTMFKYFFFKKEKVSIFKLGNFEKLPRQEF